MPSNINPSLEPTKSLDKFRFWCQKVLPLVYDDSLSYYEVLGKMVVQLNDVIDDVNADTENVLTLKDAFLELQTYVNNFFDDIDQLASYAERAEAAQTAANQSAINAASSASNASASSLAAMNARDTAVTAREAAQASANTASEAATNANTKANEAAQSAITAQTAATNAADSATAASGSAVNATASAASALQNFQLSDAARVAAQEAAENAQGVMESIPEDYTTLSNTVQDLNIVYPQNIMSFYNTFSMARTQKETEFFTIKNNKIIVEKNNSTMVNWFWLPFMLPNATPMTGNDFTTFLNDNKNNFQKRMFNRVSIYGYTDKGVSSYFGFGLSISYLDANNEVVTRTKNLQFTTDAIIYELLSEEERAAEYINISVFIRSNEAPTNNAIMIIGFENV